MCACAGVPTPAPLVLYAVCEPGSCELDAGGARVRRAAGVVGRVAGDLARAEGLRVVGCLRAGGGRAGHALDASCAMEVEFEGPVRAQISLGGGITLVVD